MSCWRLVLLWALMACGPSVGFAQSSGWNSRQGVDLRQTGPGSVRAQPSDLDRLLAQRSRVLNPATQPSDGAALLRDLLKGPGPRGELAVTATRVVTAAAVAKGVARAIPLLGTALAVRDLLDEIRCRQAASASQPECDFGQPTVTVPGLRWTTSGQAYTAADSWEESAAIHAAAQNNSPPGCAYYVGEVVVSTGTGVTWKLRSSCGYAADRSTSAEPAQLERCPAIVVNGVEVIPSVGADGLCPKGVYEPATHDQVEERLLRPPVIPRLPDLVPEIDSRDVPLDTAPPVLEGPAVVPGPTTTTTNPDGSTVTRHVDHPVTYNPGGQPGYDWQDRATDGSRPPPTPENPDPPSVPGGSTTTEPVEFKTCGLPGTPPCKIDETGTPAAGDLDAQRDADDALSEWRTCVVSPSTCLPELPSLNWTFELPSHCGPIPMAAFAPYLTQVDVCPLQPVIHDLMSLCWVGAGLFAAVRMVFTDSVAG